MGSGYLKRHHTHTPQGRIDFKNNFGDFYLVARLLCLLCKCPDFPILATQIVTDRKQIEYTIGRLFSVKMAEFSLAETPIGKYFCSIAELGVMRIFVEHKIFDAIPDEGISIQELTSNLGVEYNLIERFSNFLLAAGVLCSPAPGIVAHTPGSKPFQDPRISQFYSYLFDFFMGPAVRWPEYFAVNGLAEPRRSNRSPGGFALGHPDKTAYEIMAAMPGLATRMNGAMAIDGDIPVTGVYDFSWVSNYAKSNPEGRHLIVDVAGGKGQALKEILEENEAIPAERCILQDQPHVIVEATKEHKDSSLLGPVEKIGHSIFEEQPTKGREENSRYSCIMLN